MSGPQVASKASGSGLAVPAADRKLINTVKEVATNHSDEEIYAMLKECNRDPNDAVQRLLNQDNFHLVKRKRDKKKEAGATKEQSDSKQSSSGSYGRGGRSSGTIGGRGAGRGAQPSRNDGSAGRSRVASVKENGCYPITISSTTGGTSLSYSQLAQPKSSSNDATNKSPLSSGGISNGEVLQETSSASNEGGWPASSGYGSLTSLQGAWLAGSGHGTIADMLKSGAHKQSLSPGSSISGDVLSLVTPTGVSLEQISASSRRMSTVDPSRGLSYEPSSLNDITSRDIGVGGIRLFSAEVPSLGLQDGESSDYGQGSNCATLSLEMEAGLYHSSDINQTVSQEELSASGFQGQLADPQEGHLVGLGSQFNGSSSYHGLQFVENQKENANVDWSSHYDEAPAVEFFTERICQDSPSLAKIPNSASKLHELNFRDSHSVIIPDHIRVSEADCTMLSFGSFDVGFDGLSSNPNLMLETESSSFSISENAAVGDLTAAMRSLSTSKSHPTLLEHEQPISSVATQNLNEDAIANGIAEENENTEEEDLSEPSSQHDHSQGFSVIDAASSDHTDQFAAASEDISSRSQDVSVAMPQYDNSTYYTDVFRPVPEMDSRYSAFSKMAASGKLPSSRAVESTTQMASPEVGNASVYPNTNIVGSQTTPAVNHGQSAMTIPQHSVHPYLTQQSGLPLGPFPNVVGYQYMPSGFSYVQNPYQHNYVGTNNYNQVPTAVGAGALKFPVPQYKTAGPFVGGMHSTMSPNSLGYGGYPSSQPTANLSVTSVNTSSFDNASSHQYKDSTLYMPSQQVDGPSVWLQSQLAREAAQGSSFYNLPGQSQPTGYSRTQSLLTHTHPAAVYGGNVYHPPQSASSLSAHQLLQQHHSLGSMGALGTQIGSYQQSQRAQPAWTPGLY